VPGKSISADPEQALRDVRSLYRMHLAAWASQALALRRSGLDRPSTRRASDAPAWRRRAA